MKFKVTKINVLTCKVIDLGQYDKKCLKDVLKGYKESAEFFGMYERKNSTWIFYVEPISFN